MPITFQPGDVVLVEFPFADGQVAKHRPALVLLDIGDADVIAARITSQATRDRYDVELLDWQNAGLKLSSIARLHKLATLDKSLVTRKLGRLSATDWLRVKETLRALWGPL